MKKVNSIYTNPDAFIKRLKKIIKTRVKSLRASMQHKIDQLTKEIDYHRDDQGILFMEFETNTRHCLAGSFDIGQNVKLGDQLIIYSEIIEIRDTRKEKDKPYDARLVLQLNTVNIKRIDVAILFGKWKVTSVQSQQDIKIEIPDAAKNKKIERK